MLREKKEPEREEKKRRQATGGGLIYFHLNNLVVMKAVMTCWGWMDEANREKSLKERKSVWGEIQLRTDCWI